MGTVRSEKLMAEEQIVAELALLGVRYLSQNTTIHVDSSRPADQLLADLIRQPSSRVRTAMIALLLEHPEYAPSVPKALMRLRGTERMLFKLFYTAAVILQKEYSSMLEEFHGRELCWLPDRYSQELGLPPELPPEERLKFLGDRHSQLTGSKANWLGTYKNVAQHLFHQKELEYHWNP
jgi:hypothetical protein